MFVPLRCWSQSNVFFFFEREKKKKERKTNTANNSYSYFYLRPSFCRSLSNTQTMPSFSRRQLPTSRGASGVLSRFPFLCCAYAKRAFLVSSHCIWWLFFFVVVVVVVLFICNDKCVWSLFCLLECSILRCCFFFCFFFFRAFFFLVLIAFLVFSFLRVVPSFFFFIAFYLSLFFSTGCI